MKKTIDQTQFATEKPLFEKPVVIEPVQEMEEKFQVENLPTGGVEKKKISKLKLALLIAGSFMLLIIILAVIIKLTSSKKQTPEEIKQAEEEQQIEEFGPFQARLNEIDEELEAADPTQQDLPFPPVDLEIGLED